MSFYRNEKRAASAVFFFIHSGVLLKTGCLLTGEGTLWIGMNNEPVEVLTDMATFNNVITVSQIPVNKYGFYVQLKDFDGNPLPNVVIKGPTGVDDGQGDTISELRTNSEGVVRFYSDKARHNVTYTGLPSDVDPSVMPSSIQGFINDVSTIIVEPDVSDFYKYSLTVKNSDGSLAANRPIYKSMSDMTAIGYTNSSGVYTTPNWTANATFSGFFYDKTKARYSTFNIPGTKGNVKEAEVQATDKFITGDLTLGSTVTMAGHSWTVCHISGNKYYLARTTIYNLTKFGDNTTYNGSTLQGVASGFESSIFSSGVNKHIKDYLMQNETHDGVTSKIFVTSYSQMNGGFSWFNSNERRICQYNGSNQYYWTSSPNGSGGVWIVYTDAYLNYGNPSGSDGFRPFACISI